MAASDILRPLVVTADIKDSQFDAVVIVTDDTNHLQSSLENIKTAIDEYKQVDGSSSVAVIPCPGLPGNRLIYSPTGPVTRDYDDVRRFKEAAEAALKKAVAAGSKAPLLVGPTHDRYPLTTRVTILGALQEIYVPLSVRETVPSKAVKVDKLGLYIEGADAKEKTILEALETGRIVTRDIGGSDPEWMAAPKVAAYVESNFKDTCIKVKVLKDLQEMEKEYPLLAAVNQAAKGVDRHTARVIYLEYVGEGTIDQTFLVVGKGVTYDTGGADIKTGGAMTGMSRDKCGAAFVAGFFQTLSMLKPKGLKVMGAMAMVRNSVGPESYVTDEIIISRAGVRVRVGNTDAEGRMAMGDVLCHMKEKALKEVKPHLFTVATLTGHVIRCFGPNYTSVNSNGPALSANTAKSLSDAGDKAADPFEIATLRREDYDFHSAKSSYEDVIQCNDKPSTMTARGHQGPMAFLVMASGLDKHGNDSKQPLPYCHMDIAGSSGTYPHEPTGSPLVAFTHAFVLNRDLNI